MLLRGTGYATGSLHSVVIRMSEASGFHGPWSWLHASWVMLNVTVGVLLRGPSAIGVAVS